MVKLEIFFVQCKKSLRGYRKGSYFLSYNLSEDEILIPNNNGDMNKFELKEAAEYFEW